MRSLALKFTLVLVVVSLLGIAFVAILASQVTQQEFANFLGRQDQSSLVTALGELYQEKGSWDGINQRTIRSLNGSLSGNTIRMFAVADQGGIVVIPNPSYPSGTEVSQRDLRIGLPIEVDGDVVGTIISQIPLSNPLSSTMESFSEKINQSLLIGALIAVFFSLFLGLIFSRTLTHQLGSLSKAAKEISKGKLNQKVQIKSKDEIGDLATAFNQMSLDLEHSRELRQQMTADIAHELRTPLSIILGRAETLADGMLSPSQEVFEVIHAEALRINRLVEDLRTLSLSDSGELSLEMRKVNICALLDTLQKGYLTSTEEQGIQLQVNCPNDLLSIDADPDRMKQIISNLVSNALRYTPRGGRIALTAVEREQILEISVEDSGTGIAQEDIPYLFNRFYRGDKSRERDKGGSGLGLAIAKSLAQAHGGDIQVDSQLGAGTKFTISLPKYSNRGM